MLRMSEEITLEIVKEAAANGDWGTNIAKGDNFYRALFRTERKDEMTMADVRLLFASYNQWIKDTEALMKKCEEKNTRDDRTAIQAAEKLMIDVADHMHQIMKKVQCENKKLKELLTQNANAMN